jgi:hypothetical protein
VADTLREIVGRSHHGEGGDPRCRTGKPSWGEVEPNFDEIDPRDPSKWGDEQWAEFEAKTRHNIAFVVREGQLGEVDPADGLVFDPVKPAPDDPPDEYWWSRGSRCRRDD